jgi:hypothetical protein
MSDARAVKAPVSTGFTDEPVAGKDAGRIITIQFHPASVHKAPGRTGRRSATQGFCSLFCCNLNLI